MKILQLSKFFPPVMGGIETVAWELAEGLHRCGMDASVLCSNQRAWSVTEQSPSGYPVVRSASLGRLLSTSMAPVMPLHLSELTPGCDIVHVHMPDPMAAFALWASGTAAKVVVHWHSDVIRQRWALKLYEPLQNWLLDRADAIVATSIPYAQSSAPLQPYADKVRVIPIGISDTLVRADPAQAETIRQRYRGRQIVFSLGRMTYYKGFDVLIDAAARMSDECVVLIGGDGELLEPMRDKVAQRGLSNKVILLGHIPDDWLASYFQACDVFCMPSTVRAEAYGVAMVEAMALGRPIVATDIPGSGVPWVNRHGVTGFNVPVRDPESLARSLSQLLDDSALRQQMGEAARRRFTQEFHAESMIQRTLSLYKDVLRAHDAVILPA